MPWLHLGVANEAFPVVWVSRGFNTHSKMYLPPERSRFSRVGPRGPGPDPRAHGHIQF